MCAATFIVDRPIFIKRRPFAVAQRDPFTGIGRIRRPIINHFNCYCILRLEFY